MSEIANHLFWISAFGVWISSIDGCARPAAAAAAAAHSGSTIPIQWSTLSMADAQPLLKLRTAGDSVDLAFKLRPPRVDKPLYFGELTNADGQTLPLVVAKENGQLKAAALEREYAFDQWQSVVAGPRPGEVWGVLDQEDQGSRGPVVVLAHSLDRGKTWQVGLLPKPCPVAAFYDLIFSPDGRGRVSLVLEKACPDDPRIKSGLYHYRTTDGGATWSAPIFEPDATRPADEVPDDEQPAGQTHMAEGAKGAKKTGERADARARSFTLSPCHLVTLSFPAPR
jgi:hypothetical protein